MLFRRRKDFAGSEKGVCRLSCQFEECGWVERERHPSTLSALVSNVDDDIVSGGGLDVAAQTGSNGASLP